MDGARKPTFSGIVAHLALKGGASVFHERAMEVGLVERRFLDDGLPMHAHMRLGSAPFFLCDDLDGMGDVRAPTEIGGASVAIHVALNMSPKDWTPFLPRAWCWR